MTPHTSEPPDWVQTMADGVRRHGLLGAHGELVPRAQDRASAVLALFGERPDGVAEVLLTQRAPGLRHHPGQIAFPGGRVDPTDADAPAAALREAREETGLDPDGVHVLAVAPELGLRISRSAVTPVLGWWSRRSPVGVVDVGEVAAVVPVPLPTLLDPVNRRMLVTPDGRTHPAFAVEQRLVWGFTAVILDRLIHLSGLEQPWDRLRVEPVPAALLRRPTA